MWNEDLRLSLGAWEEGTTDTRARTHHLPKPCQTPRVVKTKSDAGVGTLA